MAKRILDGIVVRDKNNKTIVVDVKRKYIHPFFKKFNNVLVLIGLSYFA